MSAYSCIKNLLNGNLADAKREAKRHSLAALVRGARQEFSMGSIEANAAAGYLKGKVSWEQYCERNQAVAAVLTGQTTAAPKGWEEIEADTAKHTPGTWEMARLLPDLVNIRSTVTGNPIEGIGGACVTAGSEGEANVILATAGPVMLKALQFCAKYARTLQAQCLEPNGQRPGIAELCEFEKHAEAAIKAAKGVRQ